MSDLKDKATSVAKTIAKTIVDGQLVASPEDRLARTRGCMACEHRQSDPDFPASQDFLGDRDRCLRCGCNLTLKVGAHGASCPIGKW